MQQPPRNKESSHPSSLKRAPVHPNLRDDFAVDEIQRQVGRRNPHSVLRDETPESLLPLLAYIIRLKSGSREVGDVALLREFSEFTKACRKTAKPVQAIQALPSQNAGRYSDLLSTFTEIVKDHRGSVDALQFIFSEELNVPESTDTEELIYTVIADLPFNLASWPGIWIALMQGFWGGIWQTTLFLIRLRDGKVLGKGVEWIPLKAKEIQWARWHIDRRASQEYSSSSSSSSSSAATPAQKHKSPEAHPDELPTQRPKLPGRSERPLGVYLRSPSPPREPKPSKIDNIVNSYARLPRLRYDKDADLREQLERQQRSEDEFNRKLRQHYSELKLRKKLGQLAVNDAGLLVDKTGTKSDLEKAFGRDETAEKIKRAGAVDELVALHKRVLEQDKEIEDGEFEEWARNLLEEADETTWYTSCEI
ncbi:hypothetical protein TWF730_002634 [Orbilia blumenaviensis]|uniref:Uncharacterized protein n=1 Tax=Orbilia blumenaviensis TaxID=1796055 RepID=A0AAV9UE69_9PEZI